MKKLILLLVIITICLNASPQNTGDPPPASMPTEKNKPLIDKLISVSRFEDYFNDYCRIRINREGINKKWTKEKITKTINKINYEDFKWNLYNYYSLFSDDELLAMINLMSKLNNNHIESFCFISNTSIHNSLDLKIEEYLKKE